jgi:hypothetical protein
MRKFIAAGLAAATLVGGLGAGTTASAQYRHGGGYYGGYHGGYHHDNSGAAVAAGIAGLAVGAAIASSSHPYYYNGYYYDRPYYGYSYGPRCRSYTVWDPYAYAYVVRRRCW